MHNRFSNTRRLVALVAAGLVSAAVLAQDADLLTEPGVIAGTMEIDFKTRTTPDTSGKYVDGSPAMGVQDTYKFDLTVCKTSQFTGSIVRQPNIFTKIVRKREQGAALGFDLNLSVLKPTDLKQKKTVGKWVGLVPIDTQSGAFDLAGGKKDDRPLRIDIDTVGAATGFKDMFGGRLVGKAEKKETLAEYTFKRVVGNREVKITVKKSDPMKFENLELAKGPRDSDPRVMVSGRLDYDYETGNWYTDGVRFKYAVGGKEFEDIVTGSIKWVEDPNRKMNGKGEYQFNLRFNEAKNKKPAGEAAAFEKMSEEDAFFAVDDTMPSLTGKIAYVDVMGSGDAPVSSKVTFALDANKLTKAQIMNFFKLWMICIGPTNDE